MRVDIRAGSPSVGGGRAVDRFRSTRGPVRREREGARDRIDVSTRAKPCRVGWGQSRQEMCLGYIKGTFRGELRILTQKFSSRTSLLGNARLAGWSGGFGCRGGVVFHQKTPLITDVLRSRTG